MGVNEEQIKAEAKIYLNGNMTLAGVAKSLGYSKRTLQLHLGKLEVLDPELYSLVLKKKESNQKAGRSIGGIIGKREKAYSSEKANEVAKMIITEHLTYQEAEVIFGISSSTIYEMVHSDFISRNIKEELSAVAFENQRNATIDINKGKER